MNMNTIRVEYSTDQSVSRGAHY